MARPTVEQIPRRPHRGLGDGDLDDLGGQSMEHGIRTRKREERHGDRGHPRCDPSADHVDGDKSNNAASNLEWCSQRDNNIHGIRSGLIAPTPGESNGNSKLTEDAVRYIRRSVKAGMKLAHVGNVFGIHSSYVRSIVNRTAWRHIA